MFELLKPKRTNYFNNIVAPSAYISLSTGFDYLSMNDVRRPRCSCMITTSVQMQMFGKFAEQKNNPGNDIIHLQSNAVAMINCFVVAKNYSAQI